VNVGLRIRAGNPAVMRRLVARHSRVGRAVKRLFDIAAASLGLILTAPLLAVLAALILLESGGPVLFRQRRMGRGQRPFVLTKLRTMDAGGRVTRLGRFLRPTGLDELPQLWQVLQGAMSLVGPRPEVLERVPAYQAKLPDYWARHLVRPGITGWAQVTGLRGEASSIPERLRADLEYLQSWSLSLDLRILVRTVATVWQDTHRAYRS
jgi:lipopolysaccharide/colanic/teichoic acid biosynthesis glycosyltransferase